MIVQKFEDAPILKDTDFKALWTNSFDLENLTLRDVRMISQMDDPERMLPIGTEIAATDYWGFNNPWIVVHYGEATVLDEKTLQPKKQKGFYLQMKYHCGNQSAWGVTTNGALTISDAFSGWRIIANGTDGHEHMALYSTSFNGAQYMWVPNVAQVQRTNASCFSYYTDSNTYAYRIASRYTRDPGQVTIYTSNTGMTVGLNGSRTAYAYITKYNWDSITVSNNSLSSNWAPLPRMCCFIKGKDIIEE